ncbi:MAG: prepilin-type N-terminal cleavage/methylation domain-containing protein [Oscillospiraceae bacterium]|nr:prepilin-type N-terminal cleavage/methylation domain-containing protein [Oscillospiraceae bacterium]
MNKLRSSKRKGFTLIELIVVIVIIAILVAALTPAILGVIERANVAADEADARTIVSIAMLLKIDGIDDRTPIDLSLLQAEMTGTDPTTGATTVTLYYDTNHAPVACYFEKRSAGASVGDITAAGLTAVTIVT